MSTQTQTTAPSPGFRHLPGFLDRTAQQALLEAVRAVVRAAPLYVPTMPKTGKAMSVRMTNCGTLGWVTDRERGYRYQPTHPETGAPWPPIPALLLDIWRDVAAYPQPPEACLVNFYAPDAKMGMHQDRDEEEFSAPVVSVSLGGASRLAYHGVDRIHPGTSTLLKGEGRINLTLRRVTSPVAGTGAGAGTGRS